MSINSCVLFAIGINSEEKLYVLQEYIDLLKSQFSDCDIYAGINYGAHSLVESILDSSGLTIKYERIEDASFHVSSDASSYQFALKQMMQSGKQYDVTWFVHTKGGHNQRDGIRQLYFEEFFPKRNYIERKLSELEYLGVFGYRAGHYNWANEINDKCLSVPDRLIRDIWDDANTELFPNTFCKYIVIETMFAMKSEILYKYVNTYPEFFTTPINKFPTGRWFIELELCNVIPTRMGYYPTVFYDYDSHIGKELQFTIDNWILENKLDHLKDYKTKLEDRYEYRN